jgi:hypothetical protein
MTASPGMSYSVTTSSVLLLVVAMSATVGFTDASSSSISSSSSSYRRNRMILDMLHKKRGGGGIDAIASASATYEDYDCDEMEMEMEEECVTSFYRRVREKRRALLNGPQFDQPRSARDDDYLLDSSLDSLAAATSSSTSSSSGGSDGGSSMARSVRGGGGGASSRRPRLLSSSTSLWGMPSGERHRRGEGGGQQIRSPIRHDHRRRHDRNSQGRQDDVVPLRSECGFHELLEEEDDGEKQPHHPHCLGLLRVPCSIAINSGENDDLDHNRHHQHHPKKTPVSAYVDTGAQVTVISACAAKRAGIYHLIDRRYAGRATGVGHCRVLGRIPARHVYFLLGDDENDIDNEDLDDFDGDEYQDDNTDEYNCGNAAYLSGRDFRCGGGDYNRQDVDARRARCVQMDGPALTVLEGTVTKGVDVLLGLDVLQDWEAEIRMGPSRKSITVREKNRRGFGGPSKVAAVIPFATTGAASAFDGRSCGVAGARRGIGGSNVDMHTRTGSDAFCRSSSELDTPPTASTYHDHRRHRHGVDESLHSQDRFSSSPNFKDDDFQHLIDDMEDDSEDYDDFFFSPASSDIESDLDLLDQSGHEFPDDGGKRGTRSVIYGSSTRNGNIIRPKLMVDDDILFTAVGGAGGAASMGRSIDKRDTNNEKRVEVDDVNEDEDYLQDDDDEVNITIDGEEDEKIDMSGL